jgi:quinol monooxygenase YgiN
MPTMSGQVRIITRIIAKPNQETALQSLMVEVAELARQESGCLRYDLWQGSFNSAEFVAISEWSDGEAFQTHYQSGYVSELMRAIPELVDHPPDVQWYTLVL